MPELDASLTRPKLETTLIIDTSQEEGQGSLPRPLFSLVSLNPKTAPSFEVSWSQLLALTLSPEHDPPVLSVGRHEDCNVQLTDPRVSLKHFEIVARRRRAPGCGGGGGEGEEAPDDAAEGTGAGAGVGGDLAATVAAAAAAAGRFSASSSAPPSADPFTYDCFLFDKSSNGTAVNNTVVGRGCNEKIRSGDEIVVLPTGKVGPDKKIAFLFRNATEVLATPKEVKSLYLDDFVACPICMQVIYKCVALMPCFHNFCMACCSEWMLRKEDCPVCRQAVASIMKNHAMDAVIEAFLEASPERRRTEQDLEDMDRRDRLKLGMGGKIVRDVCAVSSSTPATLRAFVAVPPPAGVRTEPLAPPPAAAAALEGGLSDPGVGTSAGGSLSERRASTPRGMSQICALQ